MRPLLFFSTFLFLSCSGQILPKEVITVDTILLFNPKHESTENISTKSFSFPKNIIIILSNDYALRLDSQLFQIVKEDSLTKLINYYKFGIIADRFYIYVDNWVKFDEILKAIKILKTCGIENYRVINTQTYFANPRKLSSIPISIKPKEPDSSYLFLKFGKNNIIARLSQTNTTLKNITELDAYFLNNKSIIFNGKIIVDIDTKSSMVKFTQLKKILLKYDYKQISLENSNK